MSYKTQAFYKDGTIHKCEDDNLSDALVEHDFLLSQRQINGGLQELCLDDTATGKIVRQWYAGTSFNSSWEYDTATGEEQQTIFKEIKPETNAGEFVGDLFNYTEEN